MPPAMRDDRIAKTSAHQPRAAADSRFLTFADRGEHELKGVLGTWRLFAVER
jgi:hypothetical protein